MAKSKTHWSRTLWAIDHAHGVSLIKAHSGIQAAKKAERLLGSSAGPYKVLKDQDQQIAWAKAMGAKIL